MKLRIEETIATPVKQVFETLSNINISGIQKVEILSDTTEGEGHRWRETREMFGKEATEDMEITHYNPRHPKQRLSISTFRYRNFTHRESTWFLAYDRFHNQSVKSVVMRQLPSRFSSS